MKKLSIIIPAHNEERRISKTLKEYYSFFKDLKKRKIIDFEIIVAINGSNDYTINIVEKISKNKPEIRFFNLERGAKGLAIISGFKDAMKRKNDLIGFVDADMATMPADYFYLIKKMDNYDGVIASRYIKGAIVKPKPSFQRIIVSRLFNFVIRSILLIPYKDTQCGAKIFKRKVIEKIISHLTFSLWAFDIDVLYTSRKLGFRVKEVPTVWGDKKYSTINFMRSGPMMVLAIIRLRLMNSWFKWTVRLYDTLVNSIRRISRKLR